MLLKKRFFILSMIFIIVTAPFASVVYGEAPSPVLTLNSLLALPYCTPSAILTTAPSPGQQLYLFPISQLDETARLSILLGMANQALTASIPAIPFIPAASAVTETVSVIPGLAMGQTLPDQMYGALIVDNDAIPPCRAMRFWW